MACGVPVVASDLPVHQEICGDAAVYFPKFSAEELGRQIANLAGSAEVQRRMVTAGEARSREFSWEKHVEELLTLAAGMAS
jgi:glycosyltransferase involved in cell wall biosynthesis